MSQKSKRLKSVRDLANELEFRTFTLVSSTINEQERSIEGVIATEQAIPELDMRRWEIVPRSLQMRGGTIPKQMPLLDSHNRKSVRDQLGSIRNLRIEGGNLVGRLFFSTSAQNEWDKVREGHITDISAGFRVIREIYIEDGKTKTIEGREFTGPQNVVVEWRAFEGSITPIGADDLAKLRGYDPLNIPQRDEQEFEMLKELRDLLLSRGMPSELDDAQAQEWMVKNADKLGERKAPEPDKKTEPEYKPVTLDDMRRLVKEDADARDAARLALRTETDELCDLMHIDTEHRSQFYTLGNMAAVKARAKEFNAERSKIDSPSHGFRGPRVTAEGSEAFRKDVSTALMERMFNHNGVSERTQKAMLPDGERGKGASDFEHKSPSDIARKCLLVQGYRSDDVDRLDKMDLFRASFGRPGDVGLQTRDSGTLHNTASFANLTESLLNKSLRAGYGEAKVTYDKIINKGDPVPDFKKKNVYTTSAVGNLTAWVDGSKPDLASFMDYKDSYGVEAFAKMLEFTWQLFQNDDMSALTKAPFKLGDAARRTINAYVWGFVTGNPTLADGQAFFLASATGNRKKANYISSGLVPTVASIGALEELMRQQVGQNTREGNTGPDILSISPRYIVTPTAVVRNTARAIVRSVSDPASSNSNVSNPYEREMEVLDEPLLAANSTTAWYMVADPALVDGIELSFLQGFETPRTWSGMDDKTLTKWWAVAQVYGGKVIDHRGWAKQAGA